MINSLPLAKIVPVAHEGTSSPPSTLLPLKALSSKPLEGVRVVELTRVIAGGIAGRLLAEMGATIVRVIDKSLPDFAIFQVST